MCNICLKNWIELIISSYPFYRWENEGSRGSDCNGHAIYLIIILSFQVEKGGVDFLAHWNDNSLFKHNLCLKIQQVSSWLRLFALLPSLLFSFLWFHVRTNSCQQFQPELLHTWLLYISGRKNVFWWSLKQKSQDLFWLWPESDTILWLVSILGDVDRINSIKAGGLWMREEQFPLDNTAQQSFRGDSCLCCPVWAAIHHMSL